MEVRILQGSLILWIVPKDWKIFFIIDFYGNQQQSNASVFCLLLTVWFWLFLSFFYFHSCREKWPSGDLKWLHIHCCMHLKTSVHCLHFLCSFKDTTYLRCPRKTSLLVKRLIFFWTSLLLITKASNLNWLAVVINPVHLTEGFFKKHFQLTRKIITQVLENPCLMKLLWNPDVGNCSHINTLWHRVQNCLYAYQ